MQSAVNNAFLAQKIHTFYSLLSDSREQVVYDDRVWEYAVIGG